MSQPNPMPVFTKGMTNVSLPGLPGAWSLTACSLDTGVGDLPHISLELVMTGQEATEDLLERNRQHALSNAPSEEARKALERMLELERAARAAGREVVAEVSGDGPAFRVHLEEQQ